MFSKTTIVLLLVSFAGASAANCPFSQGTYSANTYLNKEGRVATQGCYVDDGKMYEFNSDGTESDRDCQPASCNNVAATVINSGDVCSVTIDSCFSNQPGGGASTSLTFNYDSFSVNNNQFSADLDSVVVPGAPVPIPSSLVVDGSANPSNVYWRLKDGSNQELGNTSLNLVALDPNAPVFPNNCPFTEGDYTVNTFINKAGRVATRGCYVAANGSILETGTNSDCQPANCNNVPATITKDDESGTCLVTINQCFSNTDSDTLELIYENFDVTNNMFSADIQDGFGLLVEGSYTQDFVGWRLKNGSGNELGNVSGNLKVFNNRNLRG